MTEQSRPWGLGIGTVERIDGFPLPDRGFGTVLRAVASGSGTPALFEALRASADVIEVDSATDLLGAVTATSTADLSLIVVDAQVGITDQTRRHAVLASMLGVAHVVLCVDRMDLVDWSQQRFDRIVADFRTFAVKLDLHDLSVVPIVATVGDNIVERSKNMPWYHGGSLRYLVDQIHPASDRNLVDARLPVQYVIDTEYGFHGFAGTIASGVFRQGDEIVALPSGFTSTVTAVWGFDGERIEEACAPAATCVELADELDVGRGDVLCRNNNRPFVGHELDALVCWFSDAPPIDATYRMVHTTQRVQARIERVDYRLDVDSLHRDATQTLGRNQIGRVHLRTQRPLMFDSYRRNKATGSFLLLDEATDETVGAGVITGPTLPANKVVWHSAALSREQRATRGMTVWITGLSASGKSSAAVELERRLVAAGRPAYRLDGDNLRHGLNSDLGFGEADRAENVRRVGEVALLLADSGVIAIASLISPFREGRDRIRAAHAAAGVPFVEVFVDTPVSVCEQRDPKGMYALARSGEITGFTGVNSPYEAPIDAELVLRPSDGDAAAHAIAIMEILTL